MRSTSNRIAGVAALCAVAVGCTDVAEPLFSMAPRVGILQMEGYTGAVSAGDPEKRDTTVIWTVSPAVDTVVPAEVLVLPAVVVAGQPFEIRVTTMGESGCWRAESQAVTVSGRTVELTPYDVHSGSDICTANLPALVHRSDVTLTETGEWTVRVRGRIARYGDSAWESPVAVQKRIIVQ